MKRISFREEQIVGVLKEHGHDQLGDGRRVRILAIVDDCTRECLALVADTSISGVRVARELDRLIATMKQASDDRERQRHRADLERHPALGG